MNDIKKLIYFDQVCKKGIIPMDGHGQDESVKKALKHMSLEDATRAKRKFRKQWRKARNKIRRGRVPMDTSVANNMYGSPRQHPDARQKNFRRELVDIVIVNDHVLPIYKKIVNSVKTKDDKKV